MDIDYDEIPATVRARPDSDPRVPYADELAIEAFGNSGLRAGPWAASPSSGRRSPMRA
jgi:hypothetical protein